MWRVVLPQFKLTVEKKRTYFIQRVRHISGRLRTDVPFILLGGRPRARIWALVRSKNLRFGSQPESGLWFAARIWDLVRSPNPGFGSQHPNPCSGLSFLVGFRGEERVCKSAMRRNMKNH